ncbi:MAG TPA: phosphoribosylanthranilate isomerase [Thermoanaerobaculia bacterium]|jgi:phosphoribosylanthranilate isomerase|nr:phosphoribosylanthranilate isomerase [Thermoanaerobaculia bacterium]
MPVKVKICGITSPADALAAVEWGADYLGLNFYRASPRYVEPGRALEIADAVRGRVALVGVFVNSPRAEVEPIAGRVGLDLLQFHGDEEPGFVAPFAGRAIKAFRTGGTGGLPGPDELAAWSAVWGILIDAPHGTLYGGTGEAWDYGTVGAPDRPPEGLRLFLAGGLGPGNARQAVERVRPYAIDVCSRVESRPGIKDRELLRRLFQEVRHGETQTPP